MDLRFEKWHGTGNDFIVVDDRDGSFPSADLDLVRRLCDRHFGIGSDGLILVGSARQESADFHMEFFNPDASRSFCGNGSRCAFAFWRGLMGDKYDARFFAIDGMHTAAVDQLGVRVSLAPPRSVERISEDADLINTGSPHLLVWVNDPEAIDILPEAHRYRYDDRFKKEGVNVNFLRVHEGRVELRTYERGVEAETLSCGTGVTAAALGALHRGLINGNMIDVRTRGGDLRVDVVMEADKVSAVDLVGPAQRVYSGSISV